MIELNKKWAIGGDRDNIILYQKSKPKAVGGKPAWRTAGYYSNLHNALTALVNFEVKDTHLESLKVVIAKLDEIYDLIKRLPRISVSDIEGKPLRGKEDDNATHAR